jgi:uncharacterized protein (DUF1800 family)
VTEPRGNLTRRGLIAGTLALGATAGIVAVAGKPAEQNTSGPSRSEVPLLSGTDLLGTDPDLHLARRATYGPNASTMAEITTLGASGWLEQQLQPESVESSIESAISRVFPRLSWTAAEVAAAKHRRDATIESLPDQLLKATIARAIWSPRQLLEVMTDLWANHFNVHFRASDTLPFRHHYDQTIRSHALGTFSDLVVAAVLHPAMLHSLNNSESTKENPNENLGRELLELHTLGIGNYTEQDVKNSALMLTGHTVKKNEGVFDPRTHFVGALTIVGKTYANSTASAGDDASHAYLLDLARHPATARRVATVLATRFVSDQPSLILVETLSKVYLENDTAIPPVLRALFASPDFHQAIGKKNRRPYEDFIATMRILEYGQQPLEKKGFDALYSISRRVGQPPLSWPTPDGYPDTADAWLSPGQLLARMNMHANLATRSIADLKNNLPNPNPWLVGATFASWNEVIDATSRAVVNSTLLPPHRSALLAMLGHEGTATPALKEISPAVSAVIVPAMLNSPYHWSY